MTKCIRLGLTIAGLMTNFALAEQAPMPAGNSTIVKGFKVDLKQCKKTANQIICSLVITNQEADRLLGLYSNDSYFVDGGGMQERGYAATLGSSSVSNGQALTELVTDVPVKASITLPVGDPHATSLAKLIVGLACGEKFEVQFRKIPIE